MQQLQHDCAAPSMAAAGGQVYWVSTAGLGDGSSKDGHQLQLWAVTLDHAFASIGWQADWEPECRSFHREILILVL